MSTQPTQRPYDLKCMAIVAANKHGGMLVYVRPYCALWWELDDLGSIDLSAYGLDLAPEGVSIWEGTAVWQPGGYECPQDGQMEYNGEFRRLTADELMKLQSGESFWPDQG